MIGQDTKQPRLRRTEVMAPLIFAGACAFCPGMFGA